MDGDSGLPAIAAAEEENGHTNEAMGQVFNNGLLLDIILEKAIADGAFNDIYNCRLVSKSFLSSISHILLKKRYHLIGVDLCYNHPVTEDNDLDLAREEDGQEEGGKNEIKLLESMMEVFSSPDRLASISMLPLALYLDAKTNFFQSEKNQNIISKFLTTEVCSTNLAVLVIYFSNTMDTFLKDNHGKMLSFPNLKTFNVERFGNGGLELEHKKLAFVHDVLNGSQKLKSFEIHAPPPEKLPSFLQLPRTVEILRLDTLLTSAQFEEILLVRNPLSKLKELIVRIPEFVYEKDVKIFEKILEKFQETLTELYIRGQYEMKTPVALLIGSANIRVPVMKKLDVLSIDFDLPWSWTSAKKGTSLVECFPVLKTLYLKYMDDMAWFRFLDEGNYKSVIEFRTTIRRLDLGDGDVKQRNYDDCNLTMLQVYRLGEVFPNLQILKAPIDQLGFPVVFREMRQLKKLIVHVELNELTRDAQKWKLALLGITVEEERRVQEIPRKKRFWNGSRAVQLRREEGAVSILDMSELVYLKLSSRFTPRVIGRSLLTPRVFFRGFMQMANLKKLQFHGGFKPTQKMIRKWTGEHKGSISYNDDSGDDDDDDDSGDDDDDDDSGDNDDDDDSGDNDDDDDSGDYDVDSGDNDDSIRM